MHTHRHKGTHIDKHKARMSGLFRVQSVLFTQRYVCCTIIISLCLTTQLHTKKCLLSLMDQLKMIELGNMYVLCMASSGEKSECKHPLRDHAAQNLSTVNPHCLLTNSPQRLLSLHEGLFRVLTSPFFLLLSSLSSYPTTDIHLDWRLYYSASFTVSFSPLYFCVSFDSFHSISSYTLPALSTLSVYVCFRSVWAEAEGRSRVQLLFWHIGSYPLGLGLVAFQHQQVISRAGWKQEVGCTWWRQLVGGIVWLLPLRSHQLPWPCQSPSRGPKMRREKKQ